MWLPETGADYADACKGKLAPRDGSRLLHLFRAFNITNVKNPEKISTLSDRTADADALLVADGEGHDGPA